MGELAGGHSLLLYVARVGSAGRSADSALTRVCACRCYVAGVRYAILHRSKECVEKLVAFYPAPTYDPRVSASVCVANVAHNPVLFKAAIMWGDADVFRWLLNARQGIIVTCQGYRYAWANRVNLEIHGLDKLLYVPTPQVPSHKRQ